MDGGREETVEAVPGVRGVLDGDRGGAGFRNTGLEGVYVAWAAPAAMDGAAERNTCLPLPCAAVAAAAGIAATGPGRG